MTSTRAALDGDKPERIVQLTRAGRALLGRGYPLRKQAQAAVDGGVGPAAFALQPRSLRRLARSALALPSETSRKTGAKTVVRAS